MASGHLCHHVGEAAMDSSRRAQLTAQSVCPQVCSDGSRHQQEAAHQAGVTAQKCREFTHPGATLTNGAENQGKVSISGGYLRHTDLERSS